MIPSADQKSQPIPSNAALGGPAQKVAIKAGQAASASKQPAWFDEEEDAVAREDIPEGEPPLAQDAPAFTGAAVQVAEAAPAVASDAAPATASVVAAETTGIPTVLLAIGGIGLVAAASGGGGGSSVAVAASGPGGRVADGYVSGAKLYIDSNGDGVPDASEFSGVLTDARGDFTLPAGSPSGAIIATGGTNIDTGIPNTLILRAPAGSSIVNPLTTLVEAYQREHGGTAAAAASVVGEALGLNVDLLSYDPLALGDDATAVAVQKVAAQIATVIIQTYANPNGSDGAVAASQVVANMVAAIGAGALNLADADTLAEVQDDGAGGSLSSVSIAALQAATLAIGQAQGQAGIANTVKARLNVEAATLMPDLLAASDTGLANDDDLTHDNTPTVRVAFSPITTDATALAAGNTVKVYADGVEVGSALLRAEDLSAGHVDVTLDTLSDGTHQISARILTAAGQLGAASTALAVSVDTQAAATPGMTVMAASQNPGIASSGAVSVSAEDGVEVVVTFSNGSHSVVKTLIGTGSPIAVALGAADMATLGDGVIDVSAQAASDAAGNQSAAASAVFTLDSAASRTYTPNVGSSEGSSDASTGIALDGQWMIVGDDEANVLRVYPRDGGDAVLEWSYAANGPMLAKELDLEAGTLVGNTLYLIGSHSNKKEGGDAEADRSHLFAVTVSGTGAATEFTYVGQFAQLEAQLLAWDSDNGHGLGADHFGFAASAAAGIAPERLDGFSIEGLVAAPDDSALWLAFRAPQTDSAARDHALIVPLTNHAALLAGSAAAATFGAPIQLDLGGRGIREIQRADDGGYLILAGPSAGASDAVDRDFALFTWNGEATHAPVELANDLDSLRAESGGSLESIVGLPATLAAGGYVQLLMDNGDTIWPGQNEASKALPAAEQRFKGVWVELGEALNDVAGPVLKSAAPADGSVGIAVDSPFVLTFNEGVERGEGQIVLHRADGTVVERFAVDGSERVDFDYNVVTIFPSAPLAYESGYFLSVDDGAIVDHRGNAYAGFNDAATLNVTTAAEPTQLAAGDILFVAGNAEAPDAIAFVLMKAINGGTSITFTDRDYNAATGFAGIGNEAAFVWTADRDYAAGTVVTIQTDAVGNPLADHGSTLGAGGGIGKSETYYAFQGGAIASLAAGSAGEISAPGTFLASLTLGGAAGAIPTELTAAGSALAFTITPANQTNARYTGSLDASDLAALATRIKGPDNWEANSTKAPGFSLVDGGFFGAPLPSGAEVNGDSVTVTWNQTLDAIHLPAAESFSITLNGSPVAVNAVSISGATLTLTLATAAIGGDTVMLAYTDPSGGDDVNAIQLLNGSDAATLASQAILNRSPDATPPVLLAGSPGDGATGVAQFADLVLTFSEAVVKGDGNLIFKGLDGATDVGVPVAGAEVSISGNQVTVNPAGLLAAGKHYAVHIDAGVFTDVAGNAYAGIADDTTLDFTTAAHPQYSLLISEVNSNAGGGDFFELYNHGDSSIDLSGWKWTDEAATFSSATASFAAGTILSPGAVLVVATSGDEAAFRSAWGLADAVAVTAISGPGLGKQDAVVVFDANGYVASAFNYDTDGITASDGSFITTAVAASGTAFADGQHAGTAYNGGIAADKTSAVWDGLSTSHPAYLAAKAGHSGAAAQAADAASVGSPGVLVASGLTATYTPNAGTTLDSSDASTAIALDASWMLVGDDEANVLRVYPRLGGEAVLEWNHAGALGISAELDLEASTRIGDTLYFLGSHSNDNVDSAHLFAVSVSGSGAATEFSLIDQTSSLKAALVAWDASNGHGLGADILGFAASSSPLVESKAVDGFNLEGLANDGTNLLLGFRAPQLDTHARDLALIVPVAADSVFSGTPVFGAPIELDLGGRGIRSMEMAADGSGFLIIAGPAAGASAEVTHDFRLYTWDGASSQANELAVDLDSLLSNVVGSFETIADLASIQAGTLVQLLQDNGDAIWPGKSTASKSLPADEQQFLGNWVALGGTASDSNGPVLTGASPNDDAIDVEVQANIVLRFDEGIQAGSGDFVIKRASDGAVVDTIHAIDARIVFNTVSLDPGVDLAAGTAYILEADATAIHDHAGNAWAGLTGTSAYHFTTAAANGGGSSYTLLMTELNSNASGGDYFELYNYGDAAIDLTGWKWDDDSANPGDAAAATLRAVTLAAGETLIVSASLDAAAFRAAWNLGPEVQVVAAGGPGLGGGDAAVLFDTAGKVVAALNYKGSDITAADGSVIATASASAGVSFTPGAHAGIAYGGASAKASAVWDGVSFSHPAYTVAVAGKDGAHAQADASNVGSPGAVAAIATGDLVFLAVNADSTDAFAFQFLKAVAAGTEIVFTDRNYSEATGMPGSGEAAYVWTADQAYDAGTIVTIQPDQTGNPLVDHGSVIGAGGGISTSAETIYAFTGGVAGLGNGSAGALTVDDFLAAINVGGAAAGDVPTALAGVYTSFAQEDVHYAGLAWQGAADTAAFLARLEDAGNWNLGDSPAHQLVEGSLYGAPASITTISALQGAGAATPLLNGYHWVEAVVTAFMPGMNGFYLQEEAADADGDDATSEGLFVYFGTNAPGISAANVGDSVRLYGQITEYNGLTELKNISNVQMVRDGDIGDLPAAVSLTLPIADDALWERYEGMRVEIRAESGDLYVTDNYNLGRYGEITLSSGGVLRQFTETHAPDVAANDAHNAATRANQIRLDDGIGAQNPDPVAFARDGADLSAANTLRAGDSTSSIIGILDQFATGSESAYETTYRVQATVDPLFTGAARPGAADLQAAIGAPEIKVASANVLNFFTTYGAAHFTTPYGTTQQGRGADDAMEYQRQLDKLLDNLLGMDADVYGLMEVQNNGYGEGSALKALVDAMNARVGSSKFDYIKGPFASGAGEAPTAGDDAIMVALVYDSTAMAPLGQAAVPDSAVYDAFGASYGNRVPVAQTFQCLLDGETFTVVANHLKSKGSVLDADIGDGQGANNQARMQGVTDLVTWLSTNPTGAPDGDTMLLGDFNAYTMEDPIAYLQSHGYGLLDGGLSYSFDGLWGSLDHVFVSASLAPQVTAVADWAINAEEPVVLDYNTNYKSAGQIASLYDDTAYRSSDHNPILVGLDLAGAAADTRAPVLQTAIANADTISLGYDENLRTDSLPAADRFAVSVNGGAGPAVISLAVRGGEVNLTLASPLAFGDSIAITYADPAGDDADALQDLAGNDADALAGQAVANHTPVLDTTAPALVSSGPADDATGVAVGANLVFTFSEAMEKGSGLIVIRHQADGSLLESIDVTSDRVSVAGAEVTVNPSSDLALGVGYYVEMAAGVLTDMAGNAYAGLQGDAALNFSSQPGTTVFISELHYDNSGSDVNEGVGIFGQAGSDLTGWSVVFYNGNGGAPYSTLALSGVIDDEGAGYGELAFMQPASPGIQNGAPDALALVDASGGLVQFLSYEGSFAGVGGAAQGITSQDIGVAETGTEIAGLSLQLSGNGHVYETLLWNNPATASLGAINPGLIV